MDPHAENEYSTSPFAYCGNNPVNAIDPNGQDYIFNIIRNKAGDITGLEIKATVYITGTNASKDRASELNKLAKKTFTSRNVGDVTVSFNVNYEYKKEVSSKELKAGENILDFNNTISTDEDRSHVNGRIKDSQHFTGNTGEIHQGDGNSDVMHETGHFLGLPDRYFEYPPDNWFPKTRFEAMPGFEKDLMSNPNNLHLERLYYNQYIQKAKSIDPNAKIVNGYLQIGRDKNGNLLDKNGKKVINPNAKSF